MLPLNCKPGDVIEVIIDLHPEHVRQYALYIRNQTADLERSRIEGYQYATLKSAQADAGVIARNVRDMGFRSEIIVADVLLS